MDDILIIHRSKEFLANALKRIRDLIYSCKLKINSKTKIGKIRAGIDFVGYKTWYNRKVIRKRTLYNIKRKLKKNPDIQRISSFLAHSKRTGSIIYVALKILEMTELKDFVKKWIIKNRGETYNAIFQN